MILDGIKTARRMGREIGDRHFTRHNERDQTGEQTKHKQEPATEFEPREKRQKGKKPGSRL